jgi:type IV pilus assembly protein PilA
MQRLCFPSRRRRLAGFTFIELLYVVAIVSILVAIALPAYLDYLLRSQVAEGFVFLDDAKSPVNEFYSRWGRMPANNAEAGLRPAEKVIGKYLRSLDVSGGAMVATLRLEKGPGETIERTLTLRPWVNDATAGAPIVWSCGEVEPQLPKDYHVIGEVAPNPVEDKWVPTICRKKKQP